MDERNQVERIGDPVEDAERGRLGRATDRTREKLSQARDGLSAGASGVMERAGAAVEFVREADTDQELKSTVRTRTERMLDGAGHRLVDSAPAIGRNAERAAEKVGQALSAISRPLAAILGTVAGTLGGWWAKAAENRWELSEADEEACRQHFASVTVVTPGMTYDRARTGYALGYVASRNPEYVGRRFDELEDDLRQGFGAEHEHSYDSLREFTRYGYERGALRR